MSNSHVFNVINTMYIMGIGDNNSMWDIYVYLVQYWREQKKIDWEKNRRELIRGKLIGKW